MTRIAISGHRGLPDATTRLVRAALETELAKRSPGLVGISCIADGADQLFAQTVLALGGTLEVMVPSAQYRDRLPSEAHETYDALLAQAHAVYQTGRNEDGPEAHQAASEKMVNLADLLMAVWDGKPSRSYGGTADVVAYARQLGVPVVVVWPDGATRD